MLRSSLPGKPPNLALLTDFYELTMAYGYWKTGTMDREAVFHLFFRSNPFRGGFAVACGLEDASFTFDRDVAKGIDGLLKELDTITFAAGAGSFAQKVERLRALVETMGGGEASQEAARLAKADQAAELVREFPDLEGHIGAEYARLAGYPEAVCAAIDEHYLPDAAGGPLRAGEDRDEG